ncbi:hypothetical protein HYX06_03800 [Candidatus Woesearchaeota archaeon]|nr:hypothetical protein [Candidatus Woesearchaeota archaeon]
MKFKLLLLAFLVILISGCNQQKEPKDCSNLRDTESQSACFIREAVLKNEPVHCDKIKSDNYKDACYLHLSGWTNNANFCDKVKLRNNIEVCYFVMAAQTNNISLCDRLRNIEGLLYKKEICYRVASIKNTKPNVRNESILDDDGVFNPMFITSEEQDRVMIEEFNKLSKK